MRKFRPIVVLCLVLGLLFYVVNKPVIASDEGIDLSASKEAKDIIKIQVMLEKLAVIVNQMANKYIEDQNYVKMMDGRIVNKLVTWGHDTIQEKRDIDTIVVHSVYDALGMNPYDTDGAMYEFAIYDVSSHYLISRNGVIYRLVKDNDLAWHAGRSQLFDGRTSVNKFSVGVELLYHEKEIPNDIQYQSLVDLVKYLEIEHNIKNITGHTNVSLTKKTDPWNFDWVKFNTLLNK